MSVFELDAYSPQQIAGKVETVGVAKARLPPLAMVMLGMCAGGFIGLGALYSTLVTSDPGLSFGAIGPAVIVWLSQHGEMNQGAVAAQYVKIAGAKVALPFWEAFFKGVLCNLLVCLALWMAMAGHSVTDKVLAIVFPVSAFVAAGFEHSIANMYLIPLGILISSGMPASTGFGWLGFAANLVPVTLGNIVGGSVMVGAVYYLIYKRALGGRPGS